MAIRWMRASWRRPTLVEDGDEIRAYRPVSQRVSTASISVLTELIAGALLLASKIVAERQGRGG